MVQYIYIIYIASIYDFNFSLEMLHNNIIIKCLTLYIFIVDCIFAIAPSGSPMTYELAAFISTPEHQVKTLIGAFTGTIIKDAVVTERRQNQQIMSSISDCLISSLEVYRGRQQITQISHSGISITHNGSIQVKSVSVITSM